MSAMPRADDRMKPWEMSWNGRTWHDMPGADFDIKKLNFYLYRMGHLKLEDVQYTGLDDVVRTRTVSVMPVSFGRMGLVKGLEAQAERRKVEREARRESVEEKLRVREWKQKMQARLVQIKQREHGSIRQLALTTGVNYDNLLKFCANASKLSVERLQRLEETLDAMDAGRFELPKCRRVKEPVKCPEGHVPFKVYVSACARRDGLKPHSFYAWLQRNPEQMPPVLKVHGRAWFVPTTAMPEEVAA